MAENWFKLLTITQNFRFLSFLAPMNNSSHTWRHITDCTIIFRENAEAADGSQEKRSVEPTEKKFNSPVMILTKSPARRK